MEPKVGVQAEWDILTDVVMHEPGTEVTYGLLYPGGNLYETVFSKKKAVAEHQKYREVLKSEGINVHLVRDLLLANPKIRKEATEYLAYRYDDSEDEERVTKLQKDERSEKIKKTCNEIDLEDILHILLESPTVLLEKKDNEDCVVGYRTNPLTNLYFTRDQQFTTDKGIVLCRMKESQRWDEPFITELAFETLGIKPVYKIQTPSIEGGDFIPAGDFALVGKGKRTSENAIIELLNSGALGYKQIAVVSNPLSVDQMHLDTWFNIAGDGLAVTLKKVFESLDRTVTIYNKVNNKYVCESKNSTSTFSDYLKSKDFNVIKVDQNSSLTKYATNFLTIKDREIVAVHINEDYPRLLDEKEGITVLREPDPKSEFYEKFGLDLHNMIRGYGGPHCTTCALYRRPVNGRQVA